MSKLTHGDLLKLGTVLGYNSLTKGLCQGFSCMWAQALLAQDEKRFFNRMELIASYNPDFEALKIDIEEAKKKVRQRSKLNKKEKELLEIPALFDGIEMYLLPMNHTDVFNRGFVLQTDINTIYPLMKSKKLENSTLSIVFDKDHIFDKVSLTVFLHDMEERLKEGNAEFPILLQSFNHCVCLKYNKMKQKWHYIDTNDFARHPDTITYFREHETPELVSSIFASLSHPASENVLFNMTMLSSANQPPELDSIEASLTQLDLQYPVTPELATQFDIHQMGLLALACEHGNLNLVKQLLNYQKIEINQEDINGSTPLFTACQSGHLSIVEKLLKQPNILINQADSDGSTPLHVACQNGHLAIVEKLLKQPDININSQDQENYSPLLIACLSPHTRNNEQQFQLLLNKEASLSLKNNQRQTALDIAIKQNNTAALTVLLKFILAHSLLPSTVMSSTSLEKALRWTKDTCPEVADYLVKFKSKGNASKFFAPPVTNPVTDIAPENKPSAPYRK